jgi:phenylalanyl-tRNA synthetase alpha chain
VDAEKLKSEALSAISAASTPDELDELRVRYLGRKSELALALREVRDRETGMLLNGVRAALEGAVADRRAALERAELDRALTEESVDVTLPGEDLPLGHLHPTTHIRRIVEEAFIGLGYEIYDDREVEWVEDNFDKLAFPEWHPTRSPRDTFFLDERRVFPPPPPTFQIHVL